MRRTKKILAISFLLLTCIAGCKDQPKESTSEEAKTETQKPFTVQFDADSAYRYVQEQVDFGPRVPGTAAHGSFAIQPLRSMEVCQQAEVTKWLSKT
jgi:hypothetical protein